MKIGINGLQKLSQNFQYIPNLLRLDLGTSCIIII